jgi:hypothetical protein
MHAHNQYLHRLLLRPQLCGRVKQLPLQAPDLQVSEVVTE